MKTLNELPLMILTILFPLVGCPQESQKSEEPNSLVDQVASVLAEGITRDQVRVVLAKVPESDTTARQQQALEQLPKNFVEITIEFNLTDVEVIESLRGQVEKDVYLQTVFGFEEALHYQGFTWQPDSKWILLLESPFDTTHAEHQRVMKALQRLKAESFLTAKNFYTIYRDGFGALCVEWPEGIEKGEMLPVASPQFVDDLKLILARLKDLAIPGKAVEPAEEFQKKLKDAYGQALFEQLMKRGATH